MKQADEILVKNTLKLYNTDNLKELLSRMSQNNPELELVIGIDGSGKSTFLKGLDFHLGYHIEEPTASKQVRDFRNTHLDSEIDGEFVDRREELYLALNKNFEDYLQRQEDGEKKVATTGSALVTLLSHAAMRETINLDPDRSFTSDAVNQWIEGDFIMPASLTLIHAPFEMILERIRERQQQGDVTEKFWGFNAPLYLHRYEQSWHMALEIIEARTDLSCLTLDSSTTSPAEMIDVFQQSR